MKRELSIAVCDTQKSDLTAEETAVRSWIAETGRQNAAVDIFPDAAAFKESLANGYGADIYLIGLHTHGNSGMDLARAVRLRQPEVPIIFVADTKTYAYEAYEMHVLRYIIRSADASETVSALELAYLLCRAAPSDTVSVRMTGETRNVNSDDVVFVENNVRNMRYVMRDGTVLNGTRRNISFEEFFAPLLASGRFVQPHKSFIVNIRYIRAVKSSSVIMTNNVQIPISRRHISEVQEAYRKYGS